MYQGNKSANVHIGGRLVAKDRPRNKYMDKCSAHGMERAEDDNTGENQTANFSHTGDVQHDDGLHSSDRQHESPEEN